MIISQVVRFMLKLVNLKVNSCVILKGINVNVLLTKEDMVSKVSSFEKELTKTSFCQLTDYIIS